MAAEVDNYIHRADPTRPLIVLTAYHTLLDIHHRFELYGTDLNINQHRLFVDGEYIENRKTLRGTHSWTASTVLLRKAIPIMGRY